MLDRYGEAVERDLGCRTNYRLREFFDGTESLAVLWNFVQLFDTQRTSFLQWAQANDVELYREQRRRREERGEKLPPKRKPTIEMFEYSPEVERLSDLLELTQQLIHYTATHGSKAAKKKPKVARCPRPTTAAQKVKKADAREAMKRAEQVIVFSDEPYGADSQMVRHSKLPAVAGTGKPRQLGPQKNPKRGMRQPDADG